MMTLKEYIQNHFSPSSHKSLYCCINKYQEHTINHEKATLNDILRYLKILRESNKKQRTIANHLHSIKVYYRYLQCIGIRKDHPIKKLILIDKIDKTIKTQNLYSTKQLEEYYNQTPKHKKLMVSLLIEQALTTSELIAIKVKDINQEKAEITIKNRTLPLKAYQIYLCTEYINYIEYIKEKKQEDYLFTTRTNKAYRENDISQLINKNRPKEKQITPLIIRQSVIKNLLGHHDVRVVQVFAGHKISSTTQQYKTTQFEELKAKINLLHPLQ
ncbi:tyrosine-type recombinase/integrase [Flavobacterium oreochromis]|uniref:tyrosine-type recombinase/integrase n=1 Tax=Flavobacterium oreochromis TaxID=2906078 RepID=UPI001CE5DDD4|nr:tyrosine-type recombinase/integrase [Flavobacterium oreochromis]QYS87191.1 tyrosine-type recombinase/integrase [Flavobacterium oreochromis]QYS87203.1 tyrosine-type recombinase/integrase [Flavobacterium oreochromis]